MANTILAQKAEDGKIFWVEFTPQFHAHLVKCAVALVPRPLNKVKKVMFGYILELFNREGPQAFFDLTKGQKQATLAQKEKKRLAQKRNCILRQECWKAMEAMALGKPQWQCQHCKWEFTMQQAAKQHWCPFSKEDGDEGGQDTSKGKTHANPKVNKPLPKTPTTPSATYITTTATTSSQAPKMQDCKKILKKKKMPSLIRKPIPMLTTEESSACEAALHRVPTHTYQGELASDQQYKRTVDCHSSKLNTLLKCKIYSGLMDTLYDKWLVLSSGSKKKKTQYFWFRF
jgi:hypothetical protein